MNLFGMADATQVSDNPWEIAPNTYFCTCVDATIKEKEDGNYSLRIQWQINEPDSEYHENKVSQYHTVIIDKLYSEMSAKEKKSMKYYKLNLRNAFDLSEEDMMTFTAQDLLGRKAYITTEINSVDGTDYTNVSKVLSERRYLEENAAAEVATSAGFGI